MAWTKEFNRQYQREWVRRYRAEHRDEVREQNRAWDATHREERTTAAKERYWRIIEADPNARERRNARIRERRRQGLGRPSPEVQARRAERQRRSRRENREKYLAEKRLRRLGHDREASEYASVLLSDPCSYCGRPAETIDHIDPVSAGGPNKWANLTAACRSCNSSKYDRPLLVFLAACLPVERP